MAQFIQYSSVAALGFGTAAFGTTGFGGAFGKPWDIPSLEVPSDNIADDDNIMTDDIVQRRRGIVVDVRHYDTARQWRIYWTAVDAPTKEKLKEFWKDRRFFLVQDPVNSPNKRIEVYWPGDFPARRRRGPYWEFDFTLEEVLQ